jgi:2-polyprenyl-3-methyl-5-hydroxy-6-metoxy-1,4-benzoquinol methylase
LNVPPATFRCHACAGEVPVIEAPALQSLVGSDCTPVAGEVRVGVCRACGLLQKDTSPAWSKLCQEIYGNYRIYHQAAGHEQKARGSRNGQFGPRSELIAAFLRQSISLPHAGCVLDIGCGNGAFLRAMHKFFPDWWVTGTDLNDAFRGEIQAISTRASFRRSDELAAGRNRYDVVSLVHCIEHIPAPVAYLADARRHLKPSGLLLIEVPDAELNPFDLVVADHASHFSKAMLVAVVEAAGYDVLVCGNLVVSKEITLLARPLHDRSIGRLRGSRAAANSTAQRNLAWLAATLEQARRLTGENRPFGIFGTSIAGVWIGSALGSGIEFYVDEDELRIGRKYFGAPIIAPADIPSGGIVFVCLEPKLAGAIAARHQHSGRRFVTPPPLGEEA